MVFLICVCIAALSGMGIGGGGLFALYLKFFTEYGQLRIQTLNLLFFIFASVTALIVHVFKRKIYFIPAVIMILGGVLGSLLGSTAAIRIDGNVLGKIFGVMLILAGIYSFFGKKGRNHKK